MLIEAGVPYTQRVAILASILQESGGNPNATSKTGKYRGLLQWDSTRMPTVLSLEDQVKKIIDGINDTNAGQFTDGGKGGPYVATARSGREQFMKATDPYAATVLFNKTYVRPKEQQSWYNRADQAAAIHKLLGGLNEQKQNEAWEMPSWVWGIEQTGGYGYKSPEPVPGPSEPSVEEQLFEIWKQPWYHQMQDEQHQQAVKEMLGYQKQGGKLLKHIMH